MPLYRLDLGYRRHRVGVEYDGSSHLDRVRLRHDRARTNWLAANGWRMRHFTDQDLYRRPSQIIRTLIPSCIPSRSPGHPAVPRRSWSSGASRKVPNGIDRPPQLHDRRGAVEGLGWFWCS
ncbi:DUF559 domain-containing protein [Micromonospora sp. M12]